MKLRRLFKSINDEPSKPRHVFVLEGETNFLQVSKLPAFFARQYRTDSNLTLNQDHERKIREERRISNNQTHIPAAKKVPIALDELHNAISKLKKTITWPR